MRKIIILILLLILTGCVIHKPVVDSFCEHYQPKNMTASQWRQVCDANVVVCRQMAAENNYYKEFCL